MLNLQIKKEIKDYALENKPLEAGGVILLSGGGYQFVKCKNISFHKETEYIVNFLEWMRAEEQGKIVAIVHSQPSPEPSIKDNITAYSHNIYSIIYSWEADKFFIIEPKLADYLYKDFNISNQNCFTLLKNYYKNELNINLSDYPCYEDWHLDNPEYIYKCLKENDEFIEINKEEIRKNDILLFGDGKELGHIGIYQDNGIFLHHPRNSKSVLEDLNHHWIKKISLIVRHKSLA